MKLVSETYAMTSKIHEHFQASISPKFSYSDSKTNST